MSPTDAELHDLDRNCELIAWNEWAGETQNSESTRWEQTIHMHYNSVHCSPAYFCTFVYIGRFVCKVVLTNS